MVIFETDLSKRLSSNMLSAKTIITSKWQVHLGYGPWTSREKRRCGSQLDGLRVLRRSAASIPISSQKGLATPQSETVVRT